MITLIEYLILRYDTELLYPFLEVLLLCCRQKRDFVDRAYLMVEAVSLGPLDELDAELPPHGDLGEVGGALVLPELYGPVAHVD